MEAISESNAAWASTDLPVGVWESLSMVAWSVRENAFLIGQTKVGAAVLADSGEIFAGCNVEHKFRSHDIHAEVNAISTLVASGPRDLLVVLVVSERDYFTPCGACMDWIMQFGGPSCLVAFQTSRQGKVTVFRADELMPHYPH